MRRVADMVMVMAVFTAAGASVALAAAQARTPYSAADLDVCDPRTPRGSNARADFLFAAADGPAVPPPWQILASNVEADPSNIGALLELARCYSTFYRGLSPREGAIKTREVLQQVRTRLPRQDRARGAISAASAPPDRPRPRVGIDVPPTPKVKDRTPVYPPEAQRIHRTGLVFVEAVIDAKGKINRADVVGSIKELDGAALDAVRRWEYQPTMVDGKATEVARLLTVKFHPDASFTVTDAIDVARFQYATGSYGEVEQVLQQADAMLSESILHADAEEAAGLSLAALRASLRAASAPGTTPPKVIMSVKPAYTQEAMGAKIQGTVTLQILIHADGSVGEVVVRKSLDPLFGLDEQAVSAVKKWRFHPATVSGHPVPFVASVILDFELH